jgi:hypothetical protein
MKAAAGLLLSELSAWATGGGLAAALDLSMALSNRNGVEHARRGAEINGPLWSPKSSLRCRRAGRRHHSPSAFYIRNSQEDARLILRSSTPIIALTVVSCPYTTNKSSQTTSATPRSRLNKTTILPEHTQTTLLAQHLGLCEHRDYN